MQVTAAFVRQQQDDDDDDDEALPNAHDFMIQPDSRRLISTLRSGGYQQPHQAKHWQPSEIRAFAKLQGINYIPDGDIVRTERGAVRIQKAWRLHVNRRIIERLRSADLLSPSPNPEETDGAKQNKDHDDDDSANRRRRNRPPLEYKKRTNNNRRVLTPTPCRLSYAIASSSSPPTPTPTPHSTSSPATASSSPAASSSLREGPSSTSLSSPPPEPNHLRTVPLPSGAPASMALADSGPLWGGTAHDHRQQCHQQRKRSQSPWNKRATLPYSPVAPPRKTATTTATTTTSRRPVSAPSSRRQRPGGGMGSGDYVFRESNDDDRERLITGNGRARSQELAKTVQQLTNPKMQLAASKSNQQAADDEHHHRGTQFVPLTSLVAITSSVARRTRRPLTAVGDGDDRDRGGDGQPRSPPETLGVRIVPVIGTPSAQQCAAAAAFRSPVDDSAGTKDLSWTQKYFSQQQQQQQQQQEYGHGQQQQTTPTPTPTLPRRPFSATAAGRRVRVPPPTLRPPPITSSPVGGDGGGGTGGHGRRQSSGLGAAEIARLRRGRDLEKKLRREIDELLKTQYREQGEASPMKETIAGTAAAVQKGRNGFDKEKQKLQRRPVSAGHQRKQRSPNVNFISPQPPQRWATEELCRPMRGHPAPSFSPAGGGFPPQKRSEKFSILDSRHMRKYDEPKPNKSAACHRHRSTRRSSSLAVRSRVAHESEFK